MKASEVIKQLEDSIKYHGDVDVSMFAEDKWFKCSDVRYDYDENEIVIFGHYF